MEKPLRDSHFKIMAFLFKIRDFFVPRHRILKEVGIKAGFSVLDFGCGPGGYVAETAKLVGKSGRVYALDRHPLAIKSVNRIIDRKGLQNVTVIESDCRTGLSDSSADVVLFYDVLHELKNPVQIFHELRRVLNSDGFLSVSDHHFKKDQIAPRMTEGGLFKPAGRGKKTFTFIRT